MFTRTLTSTVATLSRTRMVRVAPRPWASSRMMPASVRWMSAERKYTPEHEWVTVSNGVATVGITQYAQEALGDVVYVEVPSKGKTVSKKDQIGAVESVKAASDIYAPVSGEIVEINSNLEEKPSLINSAPYEEGWLAKIKLSNEKELDVLLDEKAYAEHCADYTSS
ncbi:hypothetical protein HDV00_011990 [Rhizophlyctis rosea]|nr:hypothetical protein HDV00_011990 [Rhizophlyctis rosea]